MTDRLRRALLAPVAALLSLLGPAGLVSVSYAAPALRADVSAGSRAAGASTRVAVTVRPAGPLTRATLSVALPDGWPSPQRGSVRVDADGCRSGAGRLTQAGLAVAGLTCRSGASIEISAAGRLPTKAGRYQLEATVSDRSGSRTTRASFTVEAAKAHHLVLTPPSATMTYGGSRPFRAFTEDAFGNRRDDVTDRASFTLAPDGGCTGPVCGAGAHAGDHVVTATLGALSGFADLVVEPRHVTVTAASATRVYGATDPAFTYTVDGLVGSDAGLAGVTCEVSGPHAKVGEHPVTCGGARDPDYVVDRYLPGTLRVTPAPLTARVSGTQTYGGAPTYALDQLSGLVNGDTAAVVTGTLSCRTTATSGSGVGSYPITGCTGLGSANYTIGYSYGAVRVAPLAVTVRADAKTKVAGQADPAFTYTTVPAGLRLAGVSCSVSPVHSAAGVYPITCSTTTDPNYSQTSVPGTLTVTAGTLVVRVTGTQTYGGAPTYASTITSGLVNGDTAAVLHGTLSCQTSATAASAIGSYAISGCSGLSATGYTISYDHGPMQVTRKALRVRVNGTQVYGADAHYTADVVAADLVNGDTAAVVTGDLTCTTATTPGNVGTYVISGCTGLSATSYAIDYEVGGLEVSPLPVTVRADDQSRAAGAPDPAFTYTTDPAGLTLAGVTCGVAGPHDTAGTYAITCGSTTDPNYTVATVVPGTLTVTGAVAVCGDGVKQAAEACDDGNTTTESSCPYGAATCNACNATCSAVLNLTGNYCGDFKVTDAETCDDGNTVDEASCPYGQATCNTCNSSCTGVRPLTGGYCGDNVRQAEEVCDDGNSESETSCPYGMASCTACTGSCSSILNLTGDFCGDGKVTYGEACDDGNQIDSDGCTNSCTLPSG
ncbi:MBG domain-containing protein [Nocardioides sp.]|uniref:MBG domain-containing protein n=1 Tax=Nocardioides sp. TaxID=35761 RepID=UPI0025DA354D|nr:MBG domain-containing protein [Nocardioides sp.]